VTNPESEPAVSDASVSESDASESTVSSRTETVSLAVSDSGSGSDPGSGSGSDTARPNSPSWVATAAPSTDPRPQGRSGWTGWYSGLCFVAASAWALGQYTGDASWFLGLCFYIPSPFVALTSAVASLCCLRRSWNGSALLHAGFSTAACVFVFGIENHWSKRETPVPSENALRVVHWNTGNGISHDRAISRVLKGLEADIVVLSEEPLHPNQARQLEADLGAGYTVAGHAEYSFAIRGGSHNVVAQEFVANLPQILVVFRVRGRDFRVLVCDLPSSVMKPRRPWLTEIRRLIVKYRPDLVVGDFNAPRRSNQLRRLPDGYRHAYDEAGTGWGYTWPTLAPMWAIDQTIVGPDWEAVHYSLRQTRQSDHAAQMVVVQPRTEPSARSAN
jgi:endonuclease/exonuclease/phosphatase family metal-dependent hydrolase